MASRFMTKIGFVSLSLEGSLVLFCVQIPHRFLRNYRHPSCDPYLADRELSGFDYLIIVTMSLSTGVWSSPTLCPAYFTLFPETRAYFAPSLNLGRIFLQTSLRVEPLGRISGFSRSGSPSGRLR